MSSKNKRKGTYSENKIVKLLNESGIPSERMPLSGAMKRFPGDIAIGGDVLDFNYIGEVKFRKNGQGYRMLERWIKKADILFLDKNYDEPLVVIRFSLLSKLLKRSNKK